MGVSCAGQAGATSTRASSPPWLCPIRCTFSAPVSVEGSDLRREDPIADLAEELPHAVEVLEERVSADAELPESGEAVHQHDRLAGTLELRSAPPQGADHRGPGRLHAEESQAAGVGQELQLLEVHCRHPMDSLTSELP
jgi:hypothetical protein